jgi:cellulose synthase/poly-beta-1,6-N-acetylglucosamine synthase-like glycosyltransferase
MLFALFMVCVVDLGLSTILLITLGGRMRRSSRLAGLILGAGLIFASSQIGAAVWGLGGTELTIAEILVVIPLAIVIWLEPSWNPVGQVFFANFLGAAFTYLLFAAGITIAGHLSLIAAVASALLFCLEALALTLSSSFAFETCDVICRTRHSRHIPQLDPAYVPFVSLHIPAYNEPPEMLIETIKAAEQLDYPAFEIVIIDNNTKDPDVWNPVAEFCRDHPRVRFIHVEGLEGFKSGALNLALRQHTYEHADLIGVIDADYLVDPSYLRSTVGYFADPNLAFLQTPQDYRDFEQDPYFTACYDAYRYFFAMAMPSRNERNSIIFAGTMGLLKRELLTKVGGWDEWCITEDADTSLRLLRAGYSGLFINKSFGRGIMPLTFSSLKSQRFRWCFGGMQILRRHWRSLMPWDRSADNKLSISQRFDYLIGGMQWLNDLVYLGFTLVLAVVAGLLLLGDHVPVRPFIGPTVLLPAALLASGLTRATWALRSRTHISFKRAVLAFANWLSLSWTVALACLQGLTRSEGTFLRTPKVTSFNRLRSAIRAARAESILAGALLAADAALLAVTHPSVLLVVLLAWQASVYLSSPAMSLLNQRSQLTPELERRARSEARRERLQAVLKPIGVGSLVAVGGATAAFVTVLALGATNPGHPTDPFQFQGATPTTTVAPAQLSSSPHPHKPHSSHKPTSTSTTTSPGAGTSTTTSGSTSTSSTSTSSTSTSTTSPGSTTTTTPASTTTSSTTSSTTTTTPATTTTAAGGASAGGPTRPTVW